MMVMGCEEARCSDEAPRPGGDGRDGRSALAAAASAVTALPNAEAPPIAAARLPSIESPLQQRSRITLSLPARLEWWRYWPAWSSPKKALSHTSLSPPRLSTSASFTLRSAPSVLLISSTLTLTAASCAFDSLPRASPVPGAWKAEQPCSRE